MKRVCVRSVAKKVSQIKKPTLGFVSKCAGHILWQMLISMWAFIEFKNHIFLCHAGVLAQGGFRSSNNNIYDI